MTRAQLKERIARLKKLRRSINNTAEFLRGGNREAYEAVARAEASIAAAIGIMENIIPTILKEGA